MKNKTKICRCGGFTLMETLLAVALVGILVSLFLTVFVPARGMVQQALTKQESERVTGTLRAEMGTLRPDERVSGNEKKSSANKYLSPFDKSFYWMLKSKKPSSSIVIFSYRADTSARPRRDGSYPAVPANKNVPGKNTQLVSIACPMDDPIHKNDIKDAVGPVFIVKMTQLVPGAKGKDSDYKLAGSPGVIQGGSSPEAYFSSSQERGASYGGTVFFRADFYLMYPPNPARYKNRSWKRMGRPLFSANMSFHR